MNTLPVPIRSLKISFIIAWNIAGEFVSPKNITRGSNMICFECCFPLISGFDLYIVVSPMDVKLGEDVSVFEFVNDVGDKGKWVLTFDRDTIKLSVILDWSKFTVFLLHKEEGG